MSRGNRRSTGPESLGWIDNYTLTTIGVPVIGRLMLGSEVFTPAREYLARHANKVVVQEPLLALTMSPHPSNAPRTALNAFCSDTPTIKTSEYQLDAPAFGLLCDERMGYTGGRPIKRRRLSFGLQIGDEDVCNALQTERATLLQYLPGDKVFSAGKDFTVPFAYIRGYTQTPDELCQGLSDLLPSTITLLPPQAAPFEQPLIPADAV
jgi:hypothetical protein